MSIEAEAIREAKAQVISSNGEKRASKKLKLAADILSQSPMGMQLRCLQTLSQIAEEKTSTIVYPIPMNILYALWVKFDGN